jgi:hypothetical protein
MSGTIYCVKDWEIIADNLHDAGWSLGWVSALNPEGRTIWIVDAHGYEKRFIVRADEILTAFVELERAIHEFAVDLIRKRPDSDQRPDVRYSKTSFVIAIRANRS